jgi:hypothetical protein
MGLEKHAAGQQSPSSGVILSRCSQYGSVILRAAKTVASSTSQMLHNLGHAAMCWTMPRSRLLASMTVRPTAPKHTVRAESRSPVSMGGARR